MVSEWLIGVASLLAEMGDNVKSGLSCLFDVIDAVCEFVAVEDDLLVRLFDVDAMLMTVLEADDELMLCSTSEFAGTTGAGLRKIGNTCSFLALLNVGPFAFDGASKLARSLAMVSLSGGCDMLMI